MNFEEQVLGLLGQINGRLDRLETDVSELKATQAEQGELLKEHGAALGRLEEKVDELDARSLKSAVLLETDIPHQFGVLFEGHKNILDTLAPKERVEKVEKIVEERVVVLEAVVKSHSQKIAKLEKSK